MRRQLSGSWSESVCQLARLSACLLIGGFDRVNAAAHFREPALHRHDAAREKSHGDSHQPPVDLPVPVSAVSMASPKMVVASVSGKRPIAVPSATCQSRMWIAPATM